MSSPRAMGLTSTGAMSNTVLQPLSPRFAMRSTARAKAASTLPVNSGLESSFRENSKTSVLASPRPVRPVRMTLPPWGRPA